MGGAVAAIEAGFYPGRDPRRGVPDPAGDRGGGARHRRREPVRRGEEEPVEIQRLDEEEVRRQFERLGALRAAATLGRVDAR